MKYLLLLFVFLLTSVGAMAQCSENGSKPVDILKSNHSPFKIKAVNGVTSSTARVADYVEFQTMENIYAKGIAKNGSPEIKVLFPKETSIFGVVTRRKHRHFPFVGGKLELELEPLFTWDRTRIEMAIFRHGPIHKTEAEESNKELKARNNPCKDGRTNCVAGRRNSSVSPVVPAVAGAGSVAVGAVSDDDKTRFIAATAFFQLQRKSEIC